MSALRDWEKADPSGKPLGRPRKGAEDRERARLIVAMEWCLQGLGSGEPTLVRSLKGHVSRTLVRESLQSLKVSFRQRTRELRAMTRKHIEVQAKDVMWSQDAQELARGVAIAEAPQPTVTPGPIGQAVPSGSILELPIASDPGVDAQNGLKLRRRGDKAGIVQAEMIRDVASGKTLDATVGRPATVAEIIAQLERTAWKRGTFPLVYVTDNGGPYRAAKLAIYLRWRQVIHLFNEPYTPEHNAWVERGHGEHQEEMVLDAWKDVASLEELTQALQAATFTLDHRRIRRFRGWKTAANFDLALRPASGVISRAVFYETTCQAIARATVGLDRARERRRAEREAILATLQSFGLITRTRGGVPIPAPQCALIT